MTLSAPAARRQRAAIVPTGLLLLGALYCLLPVAWVLVAATKDRSELFSTPTFVPSFTGGLTDNLTELFAYDNGVFWLWILNSALYAGVGAAASTALSAAAGYALARYEFRGRTTVFNVLLAGVLLPQVVLAIPQYLLLAEFGLTDTYLSVFLPGLVSPFGIYLCRIYAAAAVPTETLDAGRIDGAGDWRLFTAIALPMMRPGLVTVFLLQFVAIWNNFLLPFVMLTDEELFPLPVGLWNLLNQGSNEPALYTLAVTGALLSLLPLVAVFLLLQRYWRADLLSGALKG